MSHRNNSQFSSFRNSNFPNPVSLSLLLPGLGFLSARTPDFQQTLLQQVETGWKALSGKGLFTIKFPESYDKEDLKPKPFPAPVSLDLEEMEQEQEQGPSDEDEEDEIEWPASGNVSYTPQFSFSMGNSRSSVASSGKAKCSGYDLSAKNELVNVLVEHQDPPELRKVHETKSKRFLKRDDQFHFHLVKSKISSKEKVSQDAWKSALKRRVRSRPSTLLQKTKICPQECRYCNDNDTEKENPDVVVTAAKRGKSSSSSLRLNRTKTKSSTAIKWKRPSTTDQSMRSSVTSIAKSVSFSISSRPRPRPMTMPTRALTQEMKIQQRKVVGSTSNANGSEDKIQNIMKALRKVGVAENGPRGISKGRMSELQEIVDMLQILVLGELADLQDKNSVLKWENNALKSCIGEQNDSSVSVMTMKVPHKFTRVTAPPIEREPLKLSGTMSRSSYKHKPEVKGIREESKPSLLEDEVTVKENDKAGKTGKEDKSKENVEVQAKKIPEKAEIKMETALVSDLSEGDRLKRVERLVDEMLGECYEGIRKLQDRVYNQEVKLVEIQAKLENVVVVLNRVVQVIKQRNKESNGKPRPQPLLATAETMVQNLMKEGQDKRMVINRK